ncbi:nonstructural protein [Microviridae sp.]|nr:nonstructural protein [Microviridae sp.]
MKLEIYAILDVKVKAFLPPIFQANNASAIRIFENCIKETGHPFNTNPGDYKLFHIGSFNDIDASITPSDPQEISNGLTVSALIAENSKLTLFPEVNEVKT